MKKTDWLICLMNNNEFFNFNLLWKKNKTTNSLPSTFFWQELMTAQYKHWFIERKHILINYWTIDRFHLASRRPYWCTKTMKWRPYWCTVRKLALSYSNISYCFTTALGPPITWVKTFYNSNHPTQHRINCIKTLFNWNDTHACTVTQNVNENKQNV
jgi:hypothetical protein